MIFETVATLLIAAAILGFFGWIAYNVYMAGVDREKEWERRQTLPKVEQLMLEARDEKEWDDFIRRTHPIRSQHHGWSPFDKR